MSRREEKRSTIYCVRIKNVRTNIVVGYLKIFILLGGYPETSLMYDVIL